MFKKFIVGLLKIGIIGYGGGSAVLPFIKEEFVEKNQIITEDEFLEILGICNVLPGPLITKYVAVLGYKLKGVFGAIAGIIAIIFPSSVMMIFIIKFFYGSGLENPKIMNMIYAIFPVISVIMALMTAETIDKARDKFSVKELAIITLFFVIILLVLKINVVFAILSVILLSIFIPKREGE